MVDQRQDNNTKNLIDYCESFANLNVRTKYQPILLLTIIDLISQNIIEENKILISDELLDTFEKYWKILNPQSTKKPGLQYPFIALENQNILHLEFKCNIARELTTINKSINKLKQAVEYVSLDDELFLLIQDSNTRQQLIDTLIAAWFSTSKQELEAILTLNDTFEEASNQELEELLDDFQPKKKFYLRKSLVRDSVFRQSVINTYNYRCSLCSLKVTKSFTQNIVDGAHIKPFAKFYDNRINNGLSLCKNHHWAFDQGIFSIDDNYKIIVTNDFSEESPNMKPIRDFQGEMILLPNSEKNYPNLESIQWHRHNIFRV